jgi:hypothetical protein
VYKGCAPLRFFNEMTLFIKKKKKIHPKTKKAKIMSSRKQMHKKQ